jgi:hypothetical protein
LRIKGAQVDAECGREDQHGQEEENNHLLKDSDAPGAALAGRSSPSSRPISGVSPAAAATTPTTTRITLSGIPTRRATKPSSTANVSSADISSRKCGSST